MGAESITILVVDDEEIPRMLRKLILQKQRYQIVTAASGKEALALLDLGGIHLVLSDQMMPGMLGTELTKGLGAGAFCPKSSLWRLRLRLSKPAAPVPSRICRPVKAAGR